MCTALRVREANAALFAPDAEFAAHPDMLIDEPGVQDSFMSADERCWIRVYWDASCLDQNGRVTEHAPAMAREQLALAA